MIYYLQTKKYLYNLKKKMTNFVILSNLCVVKKSHCPYLDGKKLPIIGLILLKPRISSLLNEKKTNFLSQKNGKLAL